MSDFLYDYQKKAVSNMKNGCILNGGVGSGKSRTGLYYYFKEQGGSFVNDEYVLMKDPLDLYIITTAMKRDSYEWEIELSNYRLSSIKNELYNNKVVIDSWNNVKKYIDVKNAFFIFDEDRVTGTGAWVKTFLKITKNNKWIMLSATPGDNWIQYCPVFIANGFYKNKTDFNAQHVIFSRFAKYPKIDGYYNEGKLLKLRRSILVDMDFNRDTIRHNYDIYTDYNKILYKDVMKSRWNPYKNEPIKQASELCYVLRQIVNSDDSRIVSLMELVEKHPKAIIFYNFDYELKLLKTAFCNHIVAEWNGHKHEPIPKTENWVYLVQYTAGAEGWNCVETDTIIFYSQNYSYKTVEQASGRIDRLNTPFKDLYYYHLKSRSNIDLAISSALKAKERFNDTKFISW